MGTEFEGLALVEAREPPSRIERPSMISRDSLLPPLLPPLVELPADVESGDTESTAGTAGSLGLLVALTPGLNRGDRL